ncbi:response regulator [Stappia indica]|uniref:response regulator n=1 Tax=Stappia indica TaxID=538381 RepID=UPI001CD7D1C9|nr:response regulator [Stappia indica]MCA1299200.1 response regulator [Stappia indica]
MLELEYLSDGVKGCSFLYYISYLIPHLIWSGLIVFVLFWVGRERLLGALGRVEKLNVAGLEIGFQHAIEEAADQRAQKLSAADLGRVSRRLAQSSQLLEGARILWVDDSPENNRREQELFEEAGAKVDVRLTNDEASRALERTRYDVILSDVARPGEEKAGLKFAEALARKKFAPPVILYVGRLEKPLPAAVFGATQRPDELVHLVLDVLARVRS